MFGFKFKNQAKANMSEAPKETFEALEAQTAAVFDVLLAYKIFSSFRAEWLERDKFGFMSDIRSYAESRDHNPLELTYRHPKVRLLVTLTVDAQKRVVFRNITAFSHPQKNEHMDYAGLNRDLAEIVCGRSSTEGAY